MQTNFEHGISLTELHDAETVSELSYSVPRFWILLETPILEGIL